MLLFLIYKESRRALAYAFSTIREARAVVCAVLVLIIADGYVLTIAFALLANRETDVMIMPSIYLNDFILLARTTRHTDFLVFVLKLKCQQ